MMRQPQVHSAPSVDVGVHWVNVSLTFEIRLMLRLFARTAPVLIFYQSLYNVNVAFERELNGLQCRDQESSMRRPRLRLQWNAFGAADMKPRRSAT
jgi:hypothetical protein